MRLNLLLPWILTLTFTLWGCGRKSPPVPPGTLKPRPPHHLSYSITKDGVVISWDVPTKNVDDSPIFGLKGFEILRARVPIDIQCRECPKRFESPVWLPFKGKLRNGLRMSYEDHTVTEDFRYFYAIRTSKGIFSRSEPSQPLELIWHAPPEAPGNVRTRRIKRNGHSSHPSGPASSCLELMWEPPKHFEDGSLITAKDLPGISYNIYRRARGEKMWVDVSLMTRQTSLLDCPTSYNQAYEYKVQSVFTYHGEHIPGGSIVTGQAFSLAGEQPITRRPRLLAAIPQKGGVELRWQAVLKEGEGFLIYRAGPDGLADPINRYPIRDELFVDTTKLPPGTYTYWVTIVKTGPDGTKDRAHTPCLPAVRLEGPPSNHVKVRVD